MKKTLIIIAVCMLLTTGCSGSKESSKDENTTEEKTQSLVEKNKLKEEVKKELKQEQEQEQQKQQKQEEKEQKEKEAEINKAPKVEARPKNESLHEYVSENTKQQWYEKLYEASHTDDFDGAYDKADYVLNEAWKAIKANSNNYTYKQLLVKQREWIASKDNMPFDEQVNETINRCYYLIDTYL